MFETPKEIVAEIKSIMNEIGLKEKGKVQLLTLIPDEGGDASNIGQPVYTPEPKWKIEIEYPVETKESSKKFSFTFATIDFRTKAEARQFLTNEIQKNVST